ncbi:hypothetical protein B0T14DRAFT_87254 [Immersiella caudata]|uniref:Uncharacterized protein n=1 Tax=Immersiella caudata TaxID=314043 RepID=A0AA39XIG2_9PEZI|nr:hypothetical protein B0T14DRAFT_87254 [Immersiella caudata]
MANATGADTEFSGDEFSNNLFSDLAPLLTLFGEQVTKQFLSMSLGWADNILLGMGPLGIMTVIVSAIRVGGVRQLKSLVGRARESQSTAEQELLSSTSPDVCELWSGKEIVRMIGSPAGMKTLITTKTEDGDIVVLDLAKAFSQGLLSSHGLRAGDASTAKLLGELSEAAPNLALNVKNATATTWELWLWASVGVILQATAMAVPGVSTYFWQWEKAGVPVPQYGYPCFLVGTLMVIVGVIACGHVIEGITTEHYFSVQAKRGLAVDKIVRLQSSCTVSDQHFTSFAIYNSEDDLEIRVSRLNKPQEQNYSTLAATATFIAVVGFIVQFIGLRALHWSATVIQLGVTLIMTGIRAYVRRGLATNPICSPVMDRHETAALTMQLFQAQAMSANSDAWSVTSKPNSNWAQRLLRLLRPTPKLPVDYPLRPAGKVPSVCVWEIPTLRHYVADLDDQYGPLVNLHVPIREIRTQSPETVWELSSSWIPELPLSDDQVETVREYQRLYSALFRPLLLEAPLQSRDPPYPSDGYPEAKEVGLHSDIRALMPRLDREVMDTAHKLGMAIEMVMARCQWIERLGYLEFKHSSRHLRSFEWLVPVAVQTLWDNKTAAAVRMNMAWQERDPEQGDTIAEQPPSWILKRQELLESVLSLWTYTLAERRDLIDKIHDFRQDVGLALTGHADDTNWAGPRVYARVVGHTIRDCTDQTWIESIHETSEDVTLLGAYLGRKILTAPSHLGVLMLPYWGESEMGLPVSYGLPVFGTLLSCISR